MNNNAETIFRYLNAVPPIGEEGVPYQLEIAKLIKMPEQIMSFEEVTELYPESDGWDVILICKN